MSETEGKKPQSGGQSASPLAIVIAIVVLLVLISVFSKLPILKSKAEPTNAVAIAANAPANAGASPKPEKAEAPTNPTKREPQPGDVIWWEVRYCGGEDPIAIFETVLDKWHGGETPWIVYGRFLHNRAYGRVEALMGGEYACHILDNSEQDNCVQRVLFEDPTASRFGTVKNVKVVAGNLAYELKRLQRDFPDAASKDM